MQNKKLISKYFWLSLKLMREEPKQALYQPLTYPALSWTRDLPSGPGSQRFKNSKARDLSARYRFHFVPGVPIYGFHLSEHVHNSLCYLCFCLDVEVKMQYSRNFQKVLRQTYLLFKRIEKVWRWRKSSTLEDKEKPQFVCIWIVSLGKDLEL